MLKFGEGVLDQTRKRVAEAGVSSQGVLREVTSIQVADAILEEAAKRRCELIVMGTHGRRGLSRLTTGSNAELVLRESPVPVLLVRLPAPKA